MRCTAPQFWLIVLATILLVPSDIRLAQSAEINLPKIQANCKIDAQRLLPSKPLSLPLSAVLAEPERAAQSTKKIAALIKAKQVDQAFLEFQRESSWVQDQTIGPLLVALVQSNGTADASQFVMAKFPPQSKQRAQGIGTIARELIKRNQFADAIALLKNLPQTSEYLSVALTPLVEALTSTHQIKKIPQVMSLFPVSNEQWTVWADIGNQIPFEPQQAQEVAGMIEGTYLRSLTLKNMATYWLSANRRNFPNAWHIANEIEDCSTRTEAFLEIFEGLMVSKLAVSHTQRAQALDQLEALVSRLDDPKLKYHDNPIPFRLSLATLNVENGREPQMIKLLERVTQDLKKSDYAAFRAATLIKLATQYESIGNVPAAVQMLDSAVAESHAAYKQETSPSYNGLPSLSPAQSRDDRLAKIAEMYRSLHQIQKARAIEQTLSSPSRVTLPELSR
jgi:hypothetical protein